jgi:hypothetical protein
VVGPRRQRNVDAQPYREEETPKRRRKSAFSKEDPAKGGSPTVSEPTSESKPADRLRRREELEEVDVAGRGSCGGRGDDAHRPHRPGPRLSSAHLPPAVQAGSAGAQGSASTPPPAVQASTVTQESAFNLSAAQNPAPKAPQAQIKDPAAAQDPAVGNPATVNGPQKAVAQDPVAQAGGAVATTPGPPSSPNTVSTPSPSPQAPVAQTGGTVAIGCPPEVVAQAGGTVATAPCPPTKKAVPAPPPPKAAPAPAPAPKAAPPPPPKALPPTGGMGSASLLGLGAGILLVGGGLIARRFIR